MAPEQGTALRTAAGEVYRGTILEHLLVQHLTAFFNVGGGNNILLEGADWNDGMDMARERGESVAFTALYASNLRDLSELVLALGRLGVAEVELAAELLLLLDTLNRAGGLRQDAGAKQGRLARLLRRLPAHRLRRQGHGQPGRSGPRSGRQSRLAVRPPPRAGMDHEPRRATAGSTATTTTTASASKAIIRNGVRMTLTGQVFTLMGGIATDEQARRSCARPIVTCTTDAWAAIG